MDNPFGQWNWSFICPTGFKPWTPNTSSSTTLAPCFQQMFLQLPVLIIFAILSAYRFGRRTNFIRRNNTQLNALDIRIIATLTLGLFPIYKYYYIISNDVDIWPIDILIGGTEIVSYIVHFGLLLSFKKYGKPSHRGPLGLSIAWVTLFLLNVIWNQTNVPTNIWPWSLTTVIAHTVYLLSLLPQGHATIRIANDERQRLLNNTYVRFQDEHDELALGHAQDEATYLSQLLFYWVNPLIDKGIAGYLRKIDDLFTLPESLVVSVNADKLRRAICITPSLFTALHKSFGFEFYSIGVLRLLADTSGFAGPLLLSALITPRENSPVNDDEFDYRPYLYAIGLFGSSVSAGLFGTHFAWKMSIVTMRMRIGLVTAIYTKTLDARSIHDASPDILNLMSTDTDRIVNSVNSFHSFWSVPFQLVVTLYLLYREIGYSFIAGIIFAVILIPINRMIAIKIGSYSESLMTTKDERISTCTEALSNIKNVKLLAWEDVFIDKILGKRAKELFFLAKRKYLDALCVYFWATTPILMSLLTFSVYVLFGNTLTAAKTFTTIALLNMLIGPLNTFPWVLNGLVEAWVSLTRVQELIDLPNIDLNAYYSPINNSIANGNTNGCSPTVFQFKNASFKFDKCRKQLKDLDTTKIVDFKLESINLDIKKGDLICLEGPIGSGKSALLVAMLAELSCTNGEVFLNNIYQEFGYVAQNPWLQRGTIRDNIIWGSVYDEVQYKRVLWACALNEDITVLGGDLVGVGEAGRTLSGGQRARIALARAVYQDKQIYLLDDILSALDPHVAAHIVKNCIFDLLQYKTKIVVTENRTMFYHANQILHVNNGTVKPSDILSGIDSDDDNLSSEDEVGPMAASLELNDDQMDELSVDSVLMEEEREYGTLSANVFQSYWKSTGGLLGLFVLLSVILMQVTRNVSDIWLTHWVSDSANDSSLTASILPIPPINTNDTATATKYFLEIYAGIAIFNSILTLIRAFLFAYAGIKAAKFIHKKLLDRVFYAKFEFFDITPLGRILNRFSSDTYTIDDSLPFILNILLAQFAGLVGALCISLYAMPWLSLLVVPLCPIYLNLQHRYRYSSRDIKRLSSNALSPLYAHFTETLQGLITIRAMTATNRFRCDFLVKLEECVRAQLTTAAAQQWLALRLQLLGSVIVGGTGLIASVTSAHLTSPEMVGLAISYSLSITGLLGGLLNALAETEQELIAVERVERYSSLEPEEKKDDGTNPPFGWPCQGTVMFNDVYLKYREHLPPSLTEITFETTSCERIGFVGRTGAGKSSIFAALYRVAPLIHGSVKIDFVDIATMPLHTLRSRIAFVPQQPFLFSGTIRENMDPRGLHLDSNIWGALNTCRAAPLVQSLGGLNGQVNINGSNLSAGQKQLICLARVFLKNSKIVCIDEGTSNLDKDSEAAIQLVLKNAFKSSTVLLIAHRLNSLKFTDRIVVMDNGRIVEEGPSNILSNDSSTLFHAMLQKQQQSKKESFFTTADDKDDAML